MSTVTFHTQQRPACPVPSRRLLPAELLLDIRAEPVAVPIDSTGQVIRSTGPDQTSYPQHRTSYSPSPPADDVHRTPTQPDRTIMPPARLPSSRPPVHAGGQASSRPVPPQFQASSCCLPSISRPVVVPGQCQASSRRPGPFHARPACFPAPASLLPALSRALLASSGEPWQSPGDQSNRRASS